MSEEVHSNNDCLLVVVMSHGSEDGEMYAAKNEKYPVEELWEKFLGDNCKSLMGKPKIFVIQACKGNMFNNGILFKPEKLEKKEVGTEPKFSDVSIPNLADLLVMCSTSNEYYKFCNEKGGSIFIQAFCEELKKNSHKDLMKILTGVNRKVAFENQSKDEDNAKMESATQMPNITSLLTKTMYFSQKTYKPEA